MAGLEVITTHINADFDGLAAMVAAKKLYPEAILVFSGSQEKNLRDFLGQSTQVYDFQRPRNIPLEEIARLIVVDTRQSSRIGPFSNCLANPGLEVHIYDHHPSAPGDMEGNIMVIRPVGSTATLFTQIFQEKGIKISSDEATLMAIAIFEDTGSFLFDTTTPDDLHAMAWLLEQGARVNTVSQFISQELTASQVAMLHDLIRSAITYTIQGIDIHVAKLNVQEYIDEFAVLVRRFMVMENLDVLFAIAAMGGRTYLIARSRIPEVNVGEIVQEFGGGGHASAASATIKDMTLIEAEEKLIHHLHKHVRPQSLAKGLMSSPVIYVSPDIPIAEANQILTRYSITVLLVLKDDREIVGQISRRVIEKAIFHGLGDQPVGEYMTTDFATLPSSATLADIQELIIEHRQRFIPVVDDGVVKGVITRTDLLHLLINDPAHLPKNLLNMGNWPSAKRHRNLNNLMVEILSRDIIVLLRKCGEVAQENGCTAYAVGGFVRDLMLHKHNFDLDIVIEGDGIKFAHKLGESLGGKVRIHEKFNTAVIKLAKGFKIDVATARLEYYEYPAAMPTVELSSIKLDLYRRDFTINAMAIHLNPELFGTLVDFFNCQNDIKDRQIRVLHNLSFVEDPARIFRAIRFEIRMGFRIGRHAEKLIKSAVKMNLFDRFYGRRFFSELKLLLSEENVLAAIQRLAEFDLLRFLHPSLHNDAKQESILAEAHRALAWHKLMFLNEPCQQWLVYLMALVSQLTIRQISVFCDRFEVPEKFRQVLVKDKNAADKIKKILNRRALMRPSEIYWLLQELSQEGLLYLMTVTSKKTGKKAVSTYVTHLRYVKTEIQGENLKKMGYTPGPLFKIILNHLLEARLNGEVHNRSEEEVNVRSNYPL